MTEFTGPVKKFEWSSDDLKDKIVPFQIACCKGYFCTSCKKFSDQPQTIEHKEGCPNTDLLTVN